MVDKELVEFCFFHEDAIRQAIFEKRNDGCIPKTGGNGTGHSKISDPTAQKALQRVEALGTVVVEYGVSINGRRSTMTLRNPEKWLRVIDYTKKYYSGRLQGELYRLKYRESVGRSEVCRRLGISISYYKTMLSDIIRFGEGAAAGLGLLFKL